MLNLQLIIAKISTVKANQIVEYNRTLKANFNIKRVLLLFMVMP